MLALTISHDLVVRTVLYICVNYCHPRLIYVLIEKYVKNKYIKKSYYILKISRTIFTLSLSIAHTFQLLTDTDNIVID